MSNPLRLHDKQAKHVATLELGGVQPEVIFSEGKCYRWHAPYTYREASFFIEPSPDSPAQQGDPV